MVSGTGTFAVWVLHVACQRANVPQISHFRQNITKMESTHSETFTNVTKHQASTTTLPIVNQLITSPASWKLLFCKKKQVVSSCPSLTAVTLCRCFCVKYINIAQQYSRTLSFLKNVFEHLISCSSVCLSDSNSFVFAVSRTGD